MIGLIFLAVSSVPAQEPARDTARDSAREPVRQEPPPAPQPVGTMSELMVKIIYPASDAILYISTRTPESEEQWNVLQGQALMLAESANLLMMPSRAMDDDQWMRDSELMLEAGIAAFEAALNKDVEALAALNDAVYMSCVVCHEHYRPDYGK